MALVLLRGLRELRGGINLLLGYMSLRNGDGTTKNTEITKDVDVYGRWRSGIAFNSMGH